MGIGMRLPPSGEAICLLLSFTVCSLPHGNVPAVDIAPDVIDTANLGDRGAVLLAPNPGRTGMEAGRGVGDVDGDGFEDIFLSVANMSPGVGSRGAAVILYGRPGLTGNHLVDATFPRKTVLRSLQATGRPGRSVGPAGDMNRDGHGDLAFAFSG